MPTRVKPRANARHILGMLGLASAADIAQGCFWYQRAYDLSVSFCHTYGLTLGQAVGVIAALSPNNKWARNVADAEAMIKLWHAGADPRTAKVCTYNANKDKAARILELGSPDSETIQEILSGQKVVAFYRCISGYRDTVCVDGHAFAIFMGERIPTTQTPNIGKALYAAITRSYILASERSFGACGHHLTPAQVQAVTWVTYRRLLGYDN
jgi:hypothetical protein